MGSVQDKFGVFWYNDREILEWEDRDFEAKAAEFASAGINIVMTFSCTHFRWTFYPYWDKITEAIGRIVRACHKYGIRVIEHHSSQLTYNPWDGPQWENLDVTLAVRHSKLENWPGLKEFIAFGDPEIRPGVRLSQCRQIDGRTGFCVRSTYKGWCHCYNNPHFRDAYFDYLATLYKTGIDGIMTDDVHFYGGGCTCRYCREKFTKETGYELPPVWEWNVFSHAYDNPVFLAWRKFRMSSLAEFQRAVNRHAEQQGHPMIRPNYHTSTFVCNGTAYPFESAGELWSHVFQENMFSSVKRISWPAWSCIAVHRTAMARKYGSQPMSMFYPFRYDDYYFCWALSRMWEHLLMATPEGSDLTSVEKMFTAFDRKYPRMIRSQPVADLAFLQPRSSLDYGPDSVEGSRRPFSVWMQAARFRNFQSALLFEDDTLEAWMKYRFVVVTGACMLSDELLSRMAEYTKRGGRLLIFGPFGDRGTDGTRRQHPESVFGLKAGISGLGKTAKGVFRYGGKSLELLPVEEGRYFTELSGGNVIAETEDGKILGVSACGGNLIWMAGGVLSRTPKASQYEMEICRWSKEPGRKEEAPPYAAGYLYDIPGKILAMLLPETRSVACSSRDYMVSFFADTGEKKYAIHCVNTAGTIVPPPEKISHDDPFTNFMPGAAKNGEEILIEFRIPEGCAVPETVSAVSPEWEGERILPVCLSGNTARITIPEDTFSGYLMIRF